MSIAMCACPNCTDLGTVKLDSFRRGGRSVFLCDFHANHLEGYTTRNNDMHGTRKAHPYTIGMENETSHSTLKARVEMAQNGFIPTSDCTVDVEYKSPIFNGLNALAKIVVTMDRLIDSGDLQIGEGCGTHTHIGNREAITPETMDYVRRFYHSLFKPLSDEMMRNPEETVKLFGRNFTYYASPINESSSPTAHVNFINLQHPRTFEFRLCKYRNAKQYMNCVKFCLAVTEAVCNNFIAHFNDTVTDTKRYPTIREYRKHKADVAAQKAVKLFHKFAANV